jgi:UDP-glucose 4-epimerase
VTALAWVVGRGGLLGSHAETALRGRDGWAVHQSDPFSWKDPDRLRAEMRAAVGTFREEGRKHRGWAVFWCAGAGTVGASAASLASECESLEFFLARLGEGGPSEGRVFLASSAGGVWGGSPDRPITEASPPRPISAYGLAQLDKEKALERWATRLPAVSTLTARLSNLYGPGQALAKPQGLVSYLSRSLIHGKPAHVFVALDTIRDYLYAEDAARAIVLGMERLEAESAEARTARHVLKIIASEQVTTIGELLGAFRRTAKRPLHVVTGLHPIASQQPSCLQFRSTVWRDEPPPARTGLVDGIDRVFRHELALHQAGALPPYAY